MTFEKWEGDRVIAKLRFIERGGERILQYANMDDATVEDGELVWRFRDVPLDLEVVGG